MIGTTMLRVGFVCVLLSAIGAAGPVEPPATRPAATPAFIHDDAHLFRPDAVALADVAVREMDRHYHKHVVIETFPAVPAEDREAVAQDKDGYFRAWLKDRFKARNVNGVFVLICTDPKTFRVTMGRETVAHGVFTPADLDRLVRQLETDLKAGQYDAALADTIEQVDQAYAAHLHPTTPPNAGDPTPGP